jgi:hypothetical protein
MRLKVGYMSRQQRRADAHESQRSGRDLPRSKDYTRKQAREWARKRN